MLSIADVEAWIHQYRVQEQQQKFYQFLQHCSLVVETGVEHVRVVIGIAVVVQVLDTWSVCHCCRHCPLVWSGDCVIDAEPSLQSVDPIRHNAEASVQNLRVILDSQNLWHAVKYTTLYIGMFANEFKRKPFYIKFNGNWWWTLTSDSSSRATLSAHWAVVHLGSSLRACRPIAPSWSR